MLHLAVALSFTTDVTTMDWNGSQVLLAFMLLTIDPRGVLAAIQILFLYRNDPYKIAFW
jgi:hypothetical protein